MTLHVLRWLVRAGFFADDTACLETCRLEFARWLVERGLLSDW